MLMLLVVIVSAPVIWLTDTSVVVKFPCSTDTIWISAIGLISTIYVALVILSISTITVNFTSCLFVMIKLNIFTKVVSWIETLLIVEIWPIIYTSSVWIMF